MLELRQHAQEIIRQVQEGERFILTYRGKLIARIEPIETAIPADDPFYRLSDLADPEAEGLTNRQIDEAIYGA